MILQTKKVMHNAMLKNKKTIWKVNRWTETKV